MKKALLPFVLAAGLTCSSCLGPNNLYNSVSNWNAELSEQDWVNEVVYLGLTIIFVYPICLAADVLVINTVGYWSGDYWVKDPGEFPGFTRGD